MLCDIVPYAFYPLIFYYVLIAFFVASGAVYAALKDNRVDTDGSGRRIKQGFYRYIVIGFVLVFAVLGGATYLFYVSGCGIRVALIVILIVSLLFSVLRRVSKLQEKKQKTKTGAAGVQQEWVVVSGDNTVVGDWPSDCPCGGKLVLHGVYRQDAMVKNQKLRFPVHAVKCLKCQKKYYSLPTILHQGSMQPIFSGLHREEDYNSKDGLKLIKKIQPVIKDRSGKRILVVNKWTSLCSCGKKLAVIKAKTKASVLGGTNANYPLYRVHCLGCGSEYDSLPRIIYQTNWQDQTKRTEKTLKDGLQIASNA